MAKTKIEIRDLTIDYVNEDRGERHRAIESLTLDVRENEFLCVVGPSGCGKSTLIAAIAGFLRPAAGELTMDGRRITGPGADRGVVFQEYALLPWKTVIDNVALGLKLRGIPRGRAPRDRPPVSPAHQPRRRRREVPARAVGRHEAAGGRGANTRERARDHADGRAVRRHRRPDAHDAPGGTGRHLDASRVTVLFVTHSVDEAVFLADRVAVLTANPGRLKAIVPVDIPRSERSWATLNADRVYVALRDQVLGLVRADLPGADVTGSTIWRVASSPSGVRDGAPARGLARLPRVGVVVRGGQAPSGRARPARPARSTSSSSSGSRPSRSTWPSSRTPDASSRCASQASS